MNDVAQIMLYIQIATVVGCLLVGSFFDLVKREVSDIPWIVMAGVGLISTIIFIVFVEEKGHYGKLIGINVGVGVLVGFLLYYTGVMGGADAKALIALSLNTSVYPFSLELTTLPVYEFVPSIFNIFFNWLLVMIIFYPLPLLFYNLYLKTTGLKLFEDTKANFSSKILMLISGYLIPVEKAKDRMDIVYSEVYNEKDEKWELKHFIQVQEVEEEEKFKKEIEEQIEKTKRRNIWVKVLPPGIVFMLIGYIVNLFVGNVLFAIYHFTL